MSASLEANISETSSTRARASRAALWQTFPLSAWILFFGGVFTLFASIGFMSLALYPQRLPPLAILTNVFVMGAFAMVYAGVSIVRRHWLIPILAIAEGVVLTLGNAYFLSNAPRVVAAGSPLRTQLLTIGIGSIASVVLGYLFFVLFFSRQGSLLFRARTEIALAGEIHRALVPAIAHDWGAFQIYGASVPSGEVGGDLVDAFGDAQGWTAYIADVSGHGVSAGLLMAMFKTAVRTTAGIAAPDVLLQEVHRALYPLKTRNMFATAGVLQFREGGLALALAGHPPLLRFPQRTRQVEEYPSADMPVGILPEQSFSSAAINCEPGDVLLLLTDGLSEVFDKTGKELGIEPIKRALAKHAVLPLPELFAQLRQVALDGGRQEDDQTMLLVRRRE